MPRMRPAEPGAAHEHCSVDCGSLAEDDLVRRVRGEFREMPGMCVTLTQASRLWTPDQEACTRVLGALVAARFLELDRTGRYRKAHGAMPRGGVPWLLHD